MNSSRFDDLIPHLRDSGILSIVDGEHVKYDSLKSNE